MATRRFSINPEDADFQVTEAVGAATVTKNIELTVNFDALTAAGITGAHQKLQVQAALKKLHSYIETKHTWPPA